LESTFTVDIEHAALNVVANDVGGFLVDGHEVTQRMAGVRHRVFEDADDEAGRWRVNDLDVVLEVI
jgi:hypothetical protein